MQFSSEDIENEGFKPLKRVPTEPKALPGRPELSRGMSFNEETGEKESQQSMWDAPSYKKTGAASMMNRANSFVGTRERSNSVVPSKDGAVVVVDPFSTGAHLAAAVTAAGYKCVCLFSIWDSPVAMLVQEGVVCEFSATLQHDDRSTDQNAAINATIKSIRELPFPIIAVIPGAETGVELADSLSSRMGLRSNGEKGSFARRNKYAMGEAVRSAGHRAVKQQNCRDLKTLYAFLDTLPQQPFKCVLKPAQSAGSDDVFLCNDYDEATVAFHRIVGKRNGLGLINEDVLAQEYLRGTEYVVDQVSKGGVHKVVTIWQYDKRFVNGAAFVYFGMKLVSCDSPLSQELIAYASKVLDALGINEGPSHMEVMYNPASVDNGGGPCLVEVGSRCHGGEGTWLPLVRECTGYTQVSVTVDVYLNGPLFDSISTTHAPLTKYAMDCDMVSRAGGIVRSMPGEALVRKFKSFFSISWEVHVGDYCPLTIDCFTRPGVVQMMNSDPKQLEKDFEDYHNLEVEGKFIDYSVICPEAPTAGSIVIVDPRNTGSHLAALSLRWGYKLILVFTQQKDGGRASSHTLLSQYGNHYKPTLMIQHNNGSQTAEEAIASTLQVLKKQQARSPILAIIPGADTGVEVADTLASRFGTRCNSKGIIKRFRDKAQIQEVLTKAPMGELSSVLDQALCHSEEAVRAFFERRQAGGAQAVVVKPRDGTGDGAIMLCHSAEEAGFAFKSIHGQENIMGVVHDGALVQEHVTGTEFVVDGMSRNGEYKVLALWECERRSFNGCDFVPFSMTMKRCAGLKETAVVSFARQTVQAMGLQNGPSSLKIVLSARTNLPVLLECNASCHDQDGTWITLAEECVGYSQVEATLSCFVRPDGYDELPAQVDDLKAEGMEVYLVSSSRGLVRDIVGLEALRALPSCKRVDMYTQPGAHVIPTCDYYSRVGTVVLVNKDRAQLEQDYRAIRQLELGQQLIKFV